MNIANLDNSEAGVIPALCLSNRDVYERDSVKSQATGAAALGRLLSRL